MTAFEKFTGTELLSSPTGCEDCEALCLRSIASAVRDIRSEDHNDALRALLRVTGGRVTGSIACQAAGCEHTEEFFSHHFIFDPL